MAGLGGNRDVVAFLLNVVVIVGAFLLGESRLSASLRWSAGMSGSAEVVALGQLMWAKWSTASLVVRKG